MKIRSPIARRRTRLEIIPLIDIMFFLLASFMMVSLQMQKVRTLKASLPTATLATSTKKPDIINLNVDQDGQVELDKKLISFPELLTALSNRHRAQHQRPRLSERQPRRHPRRDDVCAGLRQTRRHPASGLRRQSRSCPPARIIMKNFQPNLLIVLALGLCGACAWQWYLQSVQLNKIEGLNQVIFQKSSDIQGYTNSIKTMDAEISQLHDRITQSSSKPPSATINGPSPKNAKWPGCNPTATS